MSNGVSYSYRIDAVSSGVTSVWSNTVTATPQANPTTAPTSAPANFSAVGQNSQITLSWSAVSGATRYDLFRRTGSNAYSYLTTVGNLTSYVDAGLTNGVRYDYSITPYNALSGGSYWSYASAAPGPPGSAPANFSAVPGNAQVSLSWSPVFGATNYNLWRKQSTGTTWFALSTVGGTSYLDTGLVNGLLYNYSINAANANGASSLFSYVDAPPNIPAPPAAPTSLVASSPRSSTVNLTWNTAAGATSYDVLRSTTNGSSYVLRTTVSTNAWSDAIVVNGTPYYYVVLAKNSIGSSAYSNQDSVTPLAAPTGLAGTPGTSSCYLSWNPVAGATSYIVQSQYRDSLGRTIRQTFNVTGTTCRTGFAYDGSTGQYYSCTYSVQAVNSKANSDFCNGITAVPAYVDYSLNSLSLSPTTVQGGGTVTGTVTLNTSAQSDIVVNLSSNNAAAIVPSSGNVLIPAGSMSATFTLSTTTVTTQQTATITASYTDKTATATLTITVPPAGNRAPVANAQSVSTNEDTAKAITLTATDADNDPLTYSIVTPPAKGSLSGTAPNLTYTPNLNANGSDSFAFKANDGKVDSNTATVTTTINPVNDAPVANAQSISTNKNTTFNGTLTATDVDSSTLTFSVVSNVTPHGNVTVNSSTGTFTYTPNADYVGGDSFTFKANDGSLDSNAAIVSITVNAPTASVTLTGLSLAPSSATSGDNSTGTVTLSGAASSDVVVNLSSDNTAAQVPASVTIAAGQSSTQFIVTTSAVTATTTANIGATYSGVTPSVTLTKPLTITVADPTTPNGLEAVSTGSGKITLYWDFVAGASGYNVYRGASTGTEDYAVRINGAVLVNSPSYVGSSVQMFTNTGLIDGIEYFYTVKAVVNGIESAPSNEDSDIVDSTSIPWDTRDPGQITGAARSMANDSIEDGDDPIFGSDEFITAGPDGAVYDSSFSTQQLPRGTMSADLRSVALEDGTSMSLPYLSWDWDTSVGTSSSSMSVNSLSSSANYHAMAGIPGDLGYPYRGVRTQKGYNAASTDVTLGPVNITPAGADPLRKDTAYVCLGTHAIIPSPTDPTGYAATDSCDAGLSSLGGGIWSLYIKKSGNDLYSETTRGRKKYRNNFITTSRALNNGKFRTGDKVRLRMWIGGSKKYRDRRHALSVIQIGDAMDLTAPRVVFALPSTLLRMDGSNGCMYRLQQLAQTPAYKATGSSMTDFNWENGLVKNSGVVGVHIWGSQTRDTYKGVVSGTAKGGSVTTGPSGNPANYDPKVTIVAN